MSHPISRSNEVAATAAVSAAADPANLSAGELQKLGITRASTERFDVGEFRYTSLDAALAEARRQSKPTTP